MIVLIIAGGILFLIGGIIALANIGSMRRRARILNTPTSPIAQAPGQGIVEVKGRVLPSEAGLVQAPFSGRTGVWVQIKVEELRSSGRNSYWHTLLREADARPFLIDDGSGQVARILVQGANIMVDPQNVANSGTFNDAMPHLEAFLQSRGLKSTSWLGFNKRMRYSEALIMPGDPLYALGFSRREPGPPVSDGYRMVPGTQLVLFASPGPNGELIVTNKSEEQLVSRLFWPFTIGSIIAALGFLSMAAGGVLALIDSLS